MVIVYEMNGEKVSEQALYVSENEYRIYYISAEKKERILPKEQIEMWRLLYGTQEI